MYLSLTEIVPQEDDSLAVDPSNIRKDDLDTLFDNPSSDINGAIWEDLSDDLVCIQIHSMFWMHQVHYTEINLVVVSMLSVYFENKVLKISA